MAIIQAFNIDSGIAVGDVGIINTQGEFTGYFYGANTYNVTSNGTSSFLFNGADNPTLSLVRGFTYRFAVTSTGNPLWIKTDQSSGSTNAYSNVINNGTDAGTITFPVPFDAPDTLFYKSQNTPAMTGTIFIKDVGAAGPVLRVTGADASISNLTGALTVVGGTGIGGNLNVGGTDSIFTGNVTVGKILTANILTSNNLTVSGNITGNSLTVYSLNVTSGVQSSNGITVTGNTSTFTGNVVIGNSNTSINSTGILTTTIRANAVYASYYFDANGNVFTSSGGTVGGASNAFTRVAVSGQQTAIANSNNAVLTFSAGSGITLSTNGTSNTITISSSYGNTVPFLSQTFTANGAQTSFVLSSTVSATDILVTVENIPQIPNVDYTMSGAIMTFDTAPDANSIISVRTFGTATPLSNVIPILAQTFTANGSQTSFGLNGYVLATDILVLVDTVPQQPLDHYYVDGLNLKFYTAPDANAVIDVRTFGNSYAGNGYTSITGNVYTDKIYSSTVYSSGYYFYDGTPFASNPQVNQIFTANGSQSRFALANNASANDIFVVVDGLVQPTNAYLVNNGNILTFDSNLPANSILEIRTFTATSPLATNTFTSINVSGQSSIFPQGPSVLTLASGSGMTLTTNASTRTITFASSGGGGTIGNTFSNFVVSGQSPVVANSNNSTMTFAAGFGMTITTNPSTNTITFTSTAGSNTSISDTQYLSHLISGSSAAAVSVGTSATTIDQFEISKYRTGKYILSITNGSQYQASEVIILHNGTTSYIVTYGTIYTGASQLVNFTSSISSGNVLLTGTSASDTSTVKLQKNYIVV